MNESARSLMQWATKLIKRFPHRAWIIGRLLPAGLAINHCVIANLENQGSLPFIFSQITLLVTAGSAIVGLLVDLYALRSMPSIGNHVRPFALLGSFILMTGSLVLVRAIFN